MQTLWPILVVVGSNTLYNIIAKETPESVNPFASLGITYAVAAAVSLLLFRITSPGQNLWQELTHANWTAYAFGLSIVGLEFGYLFIYRVGWKMSVASLVANISLAVILLLVGWLFYHETVTPVQMLGVAFCAIGLALLGR